VVFQLPFAIANFRTPRRFSPDEFNEFKSVSIIFFYPLFAIGISTLLLQLYNIAVLNRFWPFFAGIFVHLMAAMLQFVRLVLRRPLSNDI
jgi:energy-converting hydrogenase Eha subunit A